MDGIVVFAVSVTVIGIAGVTGRYLIEHHDIEFIDIILRGLRNKHKDDDYMVVELENKEEEDDG